MSPSKMAARISCLTIVSGATPISSQKLTLSIHRVHVLFLLVLKHRPRVVERARFLPDFIGKGTGSLIISVLGEKLGDEFLQQGDLVQGRLNAGDTGVVDFGE